MKRAQIKIRLMYSGIPKSQVIGKHKKIFFDKVCLSIGNWSQKMTEEEIRMLLEKYGEVIKCELRLERKEVYVEMNSATDVIAIKRDLHGTLYKDRELEILILDAHALKIEKLSSWIPNDLLEKAFGASTGNTKCSITFINNKCQAIAKAIIKFQTKMDFQRIVKLAQQCYISISDSPSENEESVEQNNANDVFRNKNLPCMTPKFCTVNKKPVKSNLAELRIMRKYNQVWNELHQNYEKNKEVLEQNLMTNKMIFEDQLRNELNDTFFRKQKCMVALHNHVIRKMISKIQNKE
ncbi:non-POU domain-containing octamer-binding protein-like [Nylanderia fulva]|uniref:non-POU domain-containing octamer-binding protein-like n=1 Tax=Nylanderia fulva TaxID=613905 RepID=UPI0010FB9C8F|nr:non-POU domain-containing octamer-binding protein-like [Nylanderia fulva]